MKATKTKAAAKKSSKTATRSAPPAPRAVTKDPLWSLLTQVGPANPAIVAIVNRGISRASLNELGQSFGSETILREVPALVKTQLLAWRGLSEKDRARFVGWSEVLAAQIVHESVKLADMLQAFSETSSGEAAVKDSGETRYKHVRRGAIERRDHVARVLRPLLAPESVAAGRIAASRLKADTPKMLADGVREVAAVARELIEGSNEDERAALAALRIDSTLVTELDALAVNVSASGEERTKGSPATRVGQEQLDEQDGVVLRLIQVAWRAWREGRKVVPSVPLPDLGALRGLVQTRSTHGDEGEAPAPPSE